MPRSVVTRTLVLCTLLSGCRDSASPGPAAGRADVAGTYALTSVSAQPVSTSPDAVPSGEIVLGADGRATRRLRLARTANPGFFEVVEAGTFVVRGDIVELRLVLPGNPPVAVRWRAARQGATLTLRFGSASDGPDIVEVYHRR